MGELGIASQLEVGQGDMEGLKRYVQLDGTCWGDVCQQEVGLGDQEVHKRSIELSGAERLLEVNDETGRAKSVPITRDVGEERERENILNKLDMMGHRFFLRVGSK